MRGPRATQVLPLLFPLICAVARAEIRGAETIEWMVADADLVVVGRVVALREDGADHWNAWSAATIGVSETLKGPASAGHTVRLVGAGECAEFEDARQAGTPVLVFLVESTRRTVTGDGYRRFGYALRDARPSLLILDANHLDRNAFSMTPAVLKTPDEVLAVARAAARFPSTRPSKATRIEPPWNSAPFRALYGGSAVFLTYPVDVRLEQWGRNQAAAGSPSNAIEALRHFPSKENADVLRGLMLRFGDRPMTRSGYARLTRAWNDVAGLAEQTLRAWGEPVPKRIFVEIDDHYRPAGLALVCVTGGAAMLAPIALLARRARWRYRSIARLSLALVSVALVALWLRADTWIDELKWDRAASQTWISSYRGRLQFTRITNWPGSFAAEPYETFGMSMDQFHSGGASRWFEKPAVIPPRGLLFGTIPVGVCDELWANAPWPTAIERRWAGLSWTRGLQQHQNGINLPIVRAQIHLAWLIALAAAPPAWRGATWGWRWRRRRSARLAGRCAACGYDLRATPDRCPECGAAATAGSGPAPAAVSVTCATDTTCQS
jgi:hypothetical protein